MAIDFGFTIYFLDPAPLADIEKFFVQVQAKIQIHQRHSQTTVRLYQQEQESDIKIQEAEKKPAMEAANQQYKKVYEEIKGDDYEKHIYAVHQSGVDEIRDHYNQLDEQIKADYVDMADHYNKSSVATLYALLESELRRLCGHAMVHFDLSFPVERFEKSDYLYSMIEYLKLVAKLDTKEAERFLPQLQHLQFLRNRIMHNGAEFDFGKNEKLDNLIAANPESLFFNEIPDEGVRILRVRSKFIAPYYQVIANFFHTLFISLNEKLGFSLLQERVKFIFGFLSNEVAAQFISERAVRNGKQYIIKVSSQKAENTFAFNLKLTIATAVHDSISITSQVGEIANLERWINQMNANNAILRQAFIGLLEPNSNHKIELMLYPPD